MASISANGSKSHHKFTLNVTETNTSVDNNTSTISYSFVLSPITKGYDWIGWTNPSRTVSYTLNVNGTTYTGTIPNYDGTSTVTVKSGTQTVSHNSDGTKTISFYFSVTDTTGATYTTGNASANGTLALTALEKPVVGAAPIITATVVDTKQATVYLTTGKSSGTSNTFIKYHSNAHAAMMATAQHGAAIDESLYIIRNGDNTGYAAIHNFTNIESNVFTFSAEDDRGYVGTKTITVDMVNYVRLTCNIENNRPDANGDMILWCNGNYFNGSFGAVSNSLSVTYYYTGSDGSSGSGNMTIAKSGNTYRAYANLSGLNYQTTYSFTITASDKLETVTSKANGVKSVPIFHWSENDFVFEVPVTFNAGTEGGGGVSGKVDGDLTVTGNLRLKGDGNYGNTLNFGDGSYCYIAELTDDDMTIKATDLNLNVTNLYLGGKSVSCGAWTPKLNSSAVKSYTTAQGWYQKLGSTVTIGWMIRAEINSGYHNTDLVITGVPYTPSVSAFGGGVAFNIYTGAGLTFEGWAIDTSKQISVRLQPCNNTDAGNLNIASTCYYPNGGGTISLGGTICYTTSE